jgi:hypothetical protein
MTHIEIEDWAAIEYRRRLETGNVCECCGVSGLVFILVPHHFHAKGMGGRVSRNYEQNCILLCATHVGKGRAGCHEKAHTGPDAFTHLVYDLYRYDGRDPADVLIELRENGGLKVQREVNPDA